MNSQATEYSTIDTHRVIPMPHESGLGGNTAKYESSYVGGSKKRSAKRRRLSKKNRKSRRFRGTRYNRRTIG